jgi:hypothetical protein
VDKYDTLEIRLTRSPIYCSLFFIHNSVIYDPYHLGCLPEQESGQNQFMVVEFTNKIRYQLLRSHFEFLWQDQSTVGIKEVVARYRNEIRGKIP